MDRAPGDVAAARLWYVPRGSSAILSQSHGKNSEATSLRARKPIRRARPEARFTRASRTASCASASTSSTASNLDWTSCSPRASRTSTQVSTHPDAGPPVFGAAFGLSHLGPSTKAQAHLKTNSTSPWGSPKLPNLVAPRHV